tara:strand:+ start:579 stop:2339 length:1761 start_codon:yes stop_codon:yes gene_type:complete
MPKKKNGLGNFGSFNIKGFNEKTTKGKSVGAAGTYPGNRQFGSSVHRTVIEKYDIDSNWTRWRKGIEYYYSGAYLDFDELEAVLYQGTEDEINVLFDSKQFATNNADSRSHYTARRTMLGNKQLGTIVEKYVDKTLYQSEYDRNEIWLKIQQDELSDISPLRRSIGERITDGVTSANILNVLTIDKKPAVYSGKTIGQDNIEIKITLSKSAVEATPFITKNFGNFSSLIGQIGYFPDFLIDRNLDLSETFNDGAKYFEVLVSEELANKSFKLLDNTSELPPSLLDINELDEIYSTAHATGAIKANFTFQKADYQRYFKSQYLTADVVQQEVNQLSYSVMPFAIQSILIVGNQLELTAVQQQGSINLFTAGEQFNWIICADNSFTKKIIDNDADGNYLHKEPPPGEERWKRLITDIDPWIDPVFTENSSLQYAEVFCCSCPDFSHAAIRMPEAINDDGTSNNKQRRFPIPSAMSSASYEKSGVIGAAGILQSWETSKYKHSFRLCKHTIAAMFINKIKVQEPKAYPSFDSRNKFEQRLKKDMDEVANEFRSQLKRSKITTAEVIFMLSQGLNLDDIETAFVMLNSNY